MMLKVLIVDDTKSVHAFLRSLFSRAPNIEVTSVYDGEQALSLLETPNPFDLILLDWEMPILDGPSTLKEIRSLGNNTPILMMTSKNSMEDIARVLDLGASEYLMKPFTIDILFEKIGFVLGKKYDYSV